MSSTFQWDCSVAARPPKGTVSWHCHPPHCLRAGGPAGPGPAPPFLALGPASPLPSPEGHYHWRCCPHPTAQAPPGRALPPFFHLFLPPAGPRHVDFAFWCQSLELSPPGLPSSDFQPLFPSGTGPLPGNRLPGILSRESSPPVFYSPAVSLAAGILPSSHGQLPPLPHPWTAFLWRCCVSLRWSGLPGLPTHIASPPPSPL